jgi:hypothetical protein
MQYTHEINKAYADIERNIMKRINSSNQRSFRIILVSTIVAVTWIAVVFGGKIRKMLSEQTADLAKETLENESLKIQTQELAMAVVNTILNDKEVTAHAASFLREASVVKETQQALLQLTLYVLQHPDSLAQLTALSKKLIGMLAEDKETTAQVAGLLTGALEDPKLKAALAKLVAELCVDPKVQAMATELTLKVMDQPSVMEVGGGLYCAATAM